MPPGAQVDELIHNVVARKLECPLSGKVRMSLWAGLHPFRNATLDMSTCTEASPRPDRLGGKGREGAGETHQPALALTVGAASHSAASRSESRSSGADTMACQGRPQPIGMLMPSPITIAGLHFAKNGVTQGPAALTAFPSVKWNVTGGFRRRPFATFLASMFTPYRLGALDLPNRIVMKPDSMGWKCMGPTAI